MTVTNSVALLVRNMRDNIVTLQLQSLRVTERLKHTE